MARMRIIDTPPPGNRPVEQEVAITTICRLLYLRRKSQVFNTLVNSILRYTGYNKKYVSEAGLTEILPSRGDPYGRKFTDMVSEFLEEKKVGSMIFPENLPLYPGWDTSTDCAGRRKWTTPASKKAILKIILKLFKYLKDYPTTFTMPLSVIIIWEECGPCDDCGGVQLEDNDCIVYCEDCRLGHHQKCYKGPVIREGEWRCETCTNLQGVVHRQLAVNVFDQVKEEGMDIEDSEESEEGDDGDEDDEESENSIVLSGLNAPSVSVDPQLQPRIEFEAPAQSRVFPILTSARRRRTVLVVSLNDHPEIHRLVQFKHIDGLDSLFAICAQRWNVNVDRLFVQIVPLLLGFVEMVRGNQCDFEELLRAIGESWRAPEREPDVIYVPVRLFQDEIDQTIQY